MRNLRNLRHAVYSKPQDGAPITATAWDSSDLICAFGPTQTDPAITLKRLPQNASDLSQATPIASWDALPPTPDITSERILNLHYLSDTGVICLILEGGDIVIVREDPQPGQDLIEIVGSVDAGIAAASWSPDGELLVIATKLDTLLFMTRDFEGTASVTLSADDLQVSSHVSVGWGKSETQFKGRGAKAMRDPTMPEHVDEGRLSSLDDGKVVISWRGDAQFVAVNAIIAEPVERRVLRVFSREGVLESVSEPVDFLESSLSWKPSGQIIAGIQRREDRLDVVFFERNGLRHGEFPLRLSKTEIDSIAASISLSWNTDSSVLAVSFADRVQLWTMGNYHYYLKQEIKLDLAVGQTINTRWSSEKALTLACSSFQDLRVLDFTTAIAHGTFVQPNDIGIVAVIDGRQLKMTPLGIANVPPPMAYEEIALPDDVADVAVNSSGSYVAALHADSVSLWQCQYQSKSTKSAAHVSTKSLQPYCSKSAAVVRQVIFEKGETAEDDHVLVLCSQPDDTASMILRFPVTEDAEVTAEPLFLSLSDFARSDHYRICGRDSKGSLHIIREGTSSGNLSASVPSSCIAVEVWQQQDTQIVFGQTASGVLHIQSKTQTLKVTGCTSFLVTPSHLIYTTGNHLLKFVHLTASQMEIPADEPETDERCRSIERGAKLVTVMPSSFALVLQMPRGNLETIYPRALVLAGIRKAVLDRSYKKAFRICRSQRVDMNILHDYNPTQFMQDVPLFIKQVAKVEYIDLFLSSLVEDDVSKTLYRETLKAAGNDDATSAPLMNGNSVEHHDGLEQTSGKVNAICDVFLKTLASMTSTHLQSIVTAHVSKTPPDLEAGLSLISELRAKSEEEQLTQAIEHICFLSDVNQLYDAALGLYDIDVALLVAQQSQKDPREYLPYLQKLQDMQPLRRRFAIDNDLKRYKKALTHLHALDGFDEVKTYTAKHELYNDVIELYRYDNGKLVELMRLYAGFLASRNRYKEAGVAYEYVSDYASACDAYRSASLWQECLASASLAGMADDKINDIASDLADSLEEAKDFTSAATISIDYLHDLKRSAKLLCRGAQFASAIRLVTTHRQLTLLTETFDPSLIESSATMTEMLANIRTQLNAQVPRLRELRQKRTDDPMAFLAGTNPDSQAPDNDISDTISLAETNATTSAGTFMTRYTARSTGTLNTTATRKTSRARRREERKRAQGKKGSVYEAEYLVNSLARLIERVNAVGAEVEALGEALMRRRMRERAVAVTGAYTDVLALAGRCIPEVFGESGGKVGGIEEAKVVEGEGAVRPPGGEGVLWDALMAQGQKVEVPVLRKFDKLGLL